MGFWQIRGLIAQAWPGLGPVLGGRSSTFRRVTSCRSAPKEREKIARSVILHCRLCSSKPLPSKRPEHPASPERLSVRYLTVVVST